MKNLSLILFIILIYPNISLACLGLLNPSGIGKQPTGVPLTKKERNEYAAVMKNEMKKIFDSIPNLSPSEEKWLKDELSPDNPQRMIDALDSDEQHLKTAKEKTELILFALNTIVEGKYKSQKQEVLLWTAIGSEIVNPAFSEDIKILVQRKKIYIPSEDESEILSYGNESLNIACDMAGQMIFSQITMPYLADKLPK